MKTEYHIERISDNEFAIVTTDGCTHGTFPTAEAAEAAMFRVVARDRQRKLESQYC